MLALIPPTHCGAIVCSAHDEYAELASAAVRPYLEAGVLAHGGGSRNGSLQRLFRRARADPSFVLTVVAFSTSVASGDRLCAESLTGSRGSCCTPQTELSAAAKRNLQNSSGRGWVARLEAGRARFRPHAPWHRQYTPTWFDCGCGWPGRLARALGRLLPARNYRVINGAKHGTGPIHVLGLLGAAATGGGGGGGGRGGRARFAYEGAHLFVLDYAAHHQQALGSGAGRARSREAMRLLDELVLVRLLSLPSRPSVISLQLPYNGKF